MKRKPIPTEPVYRNDPPSAPHDTREGMERLIRLAREHDWFLVQSTHDAAVRLGVDVTGVSFK